MKKIVLMMLVAMVPFLTMAQKRSKKGKAKIEKVAESTAAYEFMVIIGAEISHNNRGERSSADLKVPEIQEKLIAKQLTAKSKVMIQFDFGDGASKKNVNNAYLMQNSRRFTSMTTAVNAAADKGWEFQSANVVVAGNAKVHYYYMKRNK